MNGLTRHGLSWMGYVLNLVFELKFLNVFMGREDPIEFDIRCLAWFGLFLLMLCFVCFVGVMGGIFLTPLYFWYIYLYMF